MLWIGAYADYDRGFHWSDGEVINFVNWDVGQPSNYLGKYRHKYSANNFQNTLLLIDKHI